MALSEDTMSKCSEHLRAYKSACEDHPDLKSFDSSLQQRTIKAIDSLTTGAETGTGFVSQYDIHMEVSKHQLEVTQHVEKFIVESEDNMWESKALRSLVKAYFENTKKTLEIFDNVIECVENAEMGQNYIEEAVAQFDKESAAVKGFGGKTKRYENTLKELKKFKAMGDPFDGQLFTNQVKLIQKQQELLLQEVSEAKKKIDEEIKELAEEYANAKQSSLISNVLFGAAVCIVVVGAIALLATGVGVSLVAAGLESSLPVIAMGWERVNTYLAERMDDLKKQQEALKIQKDEMSSLETDTKINQESLVIVSEVVHQLEKKILSLMKYVDEAIDNEGDEMETQLALDSIRDKVKKLTEKLKEVGESVAKHSKLILEARFHVLEKINGSGKYHHE